nr:hypothetical protein CTI12_AA329460 [Tanacetum cinerariifolium]
MLATLMQKVTDLIHSHSSVAATINVGGHLLNAVTIEHSILRLPYRLKLSCLKSPERNETEIRDKFSLEWYELLVTFALCSGSWSSPVATINVGGHLLNAVTIEHSILRLPYRLKLSCLKSPERNETEIRDKFSLEWYELLVTFALCSGSWFSPLNEWLLRIIQKVCSQDIRFVH